MWLWIIDEHGSAFLQGSMETGDWFVWFVWFVWIVSTGRIPFIASELLFTFHSDTNNDPAQGFSIQVIQVTDCSPVTGPVPPPLHIKQPLCQLALTPPTAHVTSDAFLDQDLSVCSYDVIHQPGFCGVEFFFHDFYITPSVNCSENYLMIENRRFCGQQLNDMKIDVSYTVDASAIRLPFRIVDNKKFGWNFTTSPVMCPILGKVCSPSVWTSDGQFQYSSRDFTFTQCQFIIRRWSRRVCRVQVEFQQFEMRDDCSLNHFEIGGQKLCGNQTGRKMSIEFPASEESIRMPLVHQNPLDLLLNVEQVQCA